MKKPQLTLLLILLPLICLGQSKSNNKTNEIIDHVNFLASYEYICQEDSTDDSSLKLTVMSLHIGDKFSKFEHNGRYIKDSLWLNSELEGRAKAEQILNITKGNLHHMLAQYNIIKNYNNTQINHYEKILRQHYQIDENIMLNWELEQTTDTLISGYVCRKANTEYRGRKYNAWYTLSIPISEGPYKFKGLPGLIIKLEDTQKQHRFELSEFNKINYNKPIYLRDRNYKTINIKDYPKLKHNEALFRSNNISRRVENASTEKIGNTEAKILRRNNLIERY